jgi:acyl-CoA thioesterase-1
MHSAKLTRHSHNSRYICLLALALLMTSCAHPAHADKATILILGDSLSAGYGIKTEEGWVALLKQKLKNQGYDYQIINASISGETTEGGLSRLPALLTEYQPELLLIELGANDGLRGFPVKIMKNNLNAMVELGKKNQAQILLIGGKLPLNYGPLYRNLFEETYKTISQHHKIPLAPDLLGKVPLDKNLMQADGLHPTAAAQPQLLNHVYPYLQPLLSVSEKTK